jgi:hypothetical protein
VVTVEESEDTCVRENKAVAMPDVAVNEKISATVNESLLNEVNGENRKIFGSQQKLDLSKKIIALRMTVFLPVCSVRLMRQV